MNWLWSCVDRFEGAMMPDSCFAWGWVRHYPSGARIHRYFMAKIPFFRVHYNHTDVLTRKDQEGFASQMVMWFFDWQKYLPKRAISFHHWLRSEQ